VASEIPLAVSHQGPAGVRSSAVRVLVDGLPLAVDVRGDGPPVLLCNGAGEAATQWDDVLVPALLAAGCAVVTWDYRGVAPSADPGRALTMAEVVGDAGAVLDAAGRGPAVVVGYSSGGWVATELAAARPDLVRAVVALAGIGPAPAIERTWLDEQVTASAAGSPGAPAVHHWRAWQEWVDGDPERHLAALARVACPVLVIAFADDPYLTPAMAAVAAARLPTGSRHVVEGCGHTGLWDRPDVVVPLVLGFVSRPARAGAPPGTAPPTSPPP
jgi:pimeloyl-ACP methyl ester carboxylesterase